MGSNTFRMKHHTRCVAIGFIVIVLFTPSLLWAQEEGLTLEGLAERISTLTSRVSDLEDHLAKGAVVDSEGRCIVMQGTKTIQPESATKYWDTYGILPDVINLDLVYFDTESGLTGFVNPRKPTVYRET